MDKDSVISHEYPTIRGNVFDSNTADLGEDKWSADMEAFTSKVEIKREIIQLFKYELMFIGDATKRNEDVVAKMKELAIDIKDKLDRMPELKGEIEDSLYECYALALSMEVHESKLSVENYPAYLNWTLEDILNLGR